MDAIYDYLLIVIDSADQEGRYHLEAYKDEYSKDGYEWIKASTEPCWCYLDTYFEHENEYDGLYDFTAQFKQYRYDIDCDDYLEYYKSNDPEPKIERIESYSDLKKIKEFADGLYLVEVLIEGGAE